MTEKKQAEERELRHYIGGEIMTKFYVGGSLFTDKQRAQRITEGELLERVPGAEVYNPITNDEINDKTGEPTPRDIFIQDTQKILDSQVIFADLDDNDTGLSMELGIAFGVNHMRSLIIESLNGESPIQDLNLLLDSIPEKSVYATCSDVRQDTPNEQGLYKSWGHNLYVVGGVESMGQIYRSFTDAYDAYITRDGE